VGQAPVQRIEIRVVIGGKTIRVAEELTALFEPGAGLLLIDLEDLHARLQSELGGVAAHIAHVVLLADAGPKHARAIQARELLLRVLEALVAVAQLHPGVPILHARQKPHQQHEVLLIIGHLFGGLGEFRPHLLPLDALLLEEVPAILLQGIQGEGHVILVDIRRLLLRRSQRSKHDHEGHKPQKR